MSRYSKTVEYHDTEFNVAYGHDHAIGYFAQVFHASEDEPLAEQDELFGKFPKSGKVKNPALMVVAIELLDSVFADIRSGAKPTERMDRDPDTHLGARLAAHLMPVKGNA
jgi:hypothetical protein